MLTVVTGEHVVKKLYVITADNHFSKMALIRLTPDEEDCSF